LQAITRSAALTLTPEALNHQRAKAKASQLMPPELCFGAVDSLLISRVAASMSQPSFVEALDNLRTSDLRFAGFKSLGTASFKAGMIGASLSAAYASIHHFGAARRGQISQQTATSRVITDSVGGFGAGAASGLGTGMATVAFRSLGVAGIPLSLGSATLGAISGLGATLAYEASGLRQHVASSTETWLQTRQAA
jgi:hypothetical protein